MTSLLLGPVLRHVATSQATVWVETAEPCVVEILGHRERTWTIAGHHYALVCIEGLQPGSSTEYDVRIDGEVAWPPADSRRLPCRIRTLSETGPIRVAFGSCRYATAAAVADDRRFEADALVCYARKIAALPDEAWPAALILLGDQVYADETSRATKERIRARRDIAVGAKDQVADFEEYTWLYHESWTDPDVRWLLSTLPSSMMFDDHDVRDDWNTSQSWRAEMALTPWWHERIVGALSSYWVYQHLGNLGPAELAEDELYQLVRRYDGDAAAPLRDFAAAADREADGEKGSRWSFRRDFGPVRLVVIDSRCGRILAEGSRGMISAAEFEWIEEQVAGDYDHLLIGTSLPWLLPRALHDLESWNERLCDQANGERIARWSEKVRRAADLEHWAAFRESFDRLAQLIGRIGRAELASPGRRAPGTVCVLSGDVHHAYVAEAHFAGGMGSRVYQVTCSPLHNYVPFAMKLAFRISWSRLAERMTRLVLGLVGRVPTMSIEWSKTAGPYFGDEIVTLVFDGRRADLLLERSGKSSAQPDLREVARLSLS